MGVGLRDAWDAVRGRGSLSIIRDVDQSIVGFRVEEVRSGIASEIGEQELMDIPSTEVIGEESDLFAIIVDGDAGDLEFLFICLRSAIPAFQAISVAFHRVIPGLVGDIAIHGVGESEFKSIGSGIHVKDFEWGDASPSGALQAPGAVATAAPSSIGHPDEE